jgi:glycylpeptide N-tetradecanoyltransferase
LVHENTKLLEDSITEEGTIDTNTDIDKVSKEPLPLPNDFEWVTIDLNTRVNDIFEFLKENYIENDVIGFRFTYSIAMLKW